MRARAFTILEIVIVLMLVGMVATLGIGSLKSLLEKHRFQSEVDQFKTMLQELQIEALALHSDMEIHLTKNEKGWAIRSETAESILRSETIKMKEVEEITFNDKQSRSFHLNIFSTGRIDPPALIELKGSKETFWIDLREPIQIKCSQERPKQIAQKPIPKKPKVQDGPHELRI
jgi:type II secretory pathway pseudopilin PulG